MAPRIKLLPPGVAPHSAAPKAPAPNLRRSVMDMERILERIRQTQKRERMLQLGAEIDMPREGKAARAAQPLVQDVPTTPAPDPIQGVLDIPRSFTNTEGASTPITAAPAFVRDPSVPRVGTIPDARAPQVTGDPRLDSVLERIQQSRRTELPEELPAFEDSFEDGGPGIVKAPELPTSADAEMLLGELGPVERDIFSRMTEAGEPGLEALRRYSALRRTGSMGPDEYARMLDEHLADLDMGDYGAPVQDLEFRLGSNRSVTGGSPEVDLDSALQGVAPELAQEIRRLYAPSVTDIPGQRDLTSAPEPSPGLRQRDRQFVDPGRTSLVSPFADPNARVGAADDIYLANRKDFAADAESLVQELNALRTEELRMVRRIRQKAPKGTVTPEHPFAGERSPELGDLRTQIDELEERLRVMAAPVAGARESGNVTPRPPTADMLERSRFSPSLGKRHFPFADGDRVVFRDGDKVLEGTIVSRIEDERIIPSKAEVRGEENWKHPTLYHKLGIWGGDIAPGEMPKYFGNPLEATVVPKSGTGVTRVYAKGETEPKVHVKREFENPPVVRVLVDGEDNPRNVPGEALKPVSKGERLKKTAELEKLEGFLQGRQQLTMDFRQGGAVEPKVETRVAGLRKELGKDKGTQVVNPHVDAEGYITVRYSNGDVKRMPLDLAQRKGLMPLDEPVGVRVQGTTDDPVTLPIDTKYSQDKNVAEVVKIPGAVRQGSVVQTPYGTKEVVQIKPGKNKRGENVLKLLLRGVVGTGLALGAMQDYTPEDAEHIGETPVSTAGIRIIDPKMLKISRAQRAPVVTESGISSLVGAKEAILDRKAKLTQGGFEADLRDSMKRGGTANPEKNPAFGLQGIIEGGGSLMEKHLDDVRRLVAPVLDADAEDLMHAILNYRAMRNTWDLVEDKIAKGDAEAASILASGAPDADTRGMQILADLNDMKSRVAKNEVVAEGYTKEELDYRLAELKATNDPALVRKAEAAVQGFFKKTREILDLAYREGLVDKAWYDEYAGRGDYMPIYRIMELYDEANNERIRRPGSTFGDPKTSTRLNLTKEVEINQELRGSPRLPEHPTRNLINLIQGVTNEIQRNRGAKQTLDFYAEHGNKPHMQKKFGGFYNVVPAKNPDAEPPPNRAYVGYMEDGKPKVFEADVEFAQAMKEFHPDVNKALFAAGPKLFQRWAQILSAGANLPFIASQITMDPMSALMNLHFTKYQNSGIPGKFAVEGLGLLLGSLAGNVSKNIAKAGARPFGRAAAIKAEDAVEGVMQKILPRRKEFHQSPAQSRPLGTFTDAVDQVYGTKAIRDEKGGKFAKFERGAFQAAQLIQDTFLTPLEEATKYTSYAMMRERGFGPVEATYQTRVFGGSPDWNQRGTKIEPVMPYVMFINPALQGLARMYTAVKVHPKSYAKAATYAGAALAALYGHNSKFTDAEGNREIDKIPMETWANNFIYIIPDEADEATIQRMASAGVIDPDIRTTGSKRYTTIKIPMARELATTLRPFMVAMRESGDTKDVYSAGQAVMDMVNPLIPGGGSVNVGNPQSVLDRGVASLNPMFRYPIEALGTGRYSFSGTPIVGSRVAGNIPEYQSTLRTHPTWTAVGKATGTSPDYLQHFAQTFGGGTAEMLAGVAKPFVAAPEDDPLAPIRSDAETAAQTPVLGPVIRRFMDPGVSDQTVIDERTRFYNVANAIKQATATLSTQEARNPWELQKMLQSRPDLLKMDALNPQMVKWQNQLSDFDKKRELITRSPEIPPQEKQKMLQMLWNGERRFFQGVDRAIRSWEEAGLIPK